MGSIPTPTSTGFKVNPLPTEPGKKINFGAVIEGLDLNNISGTPLPRLYQMFTVTNYIFKMLRR